MQLIPSQRKHLDMLGVGAYDGEKLIGLAGCSADCDEMWQIGVDVLPDYRRQGLARNIMNALSRSACELGLGAMFLEVREQNSPARALYRSDGWAEVGVRKNFYSHPVDNAVIMQKRFER